MIYIPIHITGLRMGRPGGVFGAPLVYVVLLRNRTPLRVKPGRWDRVRRALERRLDPQEKGAPCRICGVGGEKPWFPCLACQRSGASCAKEGHPYDCEGICVFCGALQAPEDLEANRRAGERARAERRTGGRTP